MYAVMRMERFREEDEVEEILKLAIRKDAVGDVGLRERLLASAQELGISEEAVIAAEKQYRAEQKRNLELEEFGIALRKDFYSHLGIYVAVNTMLLIFNVIRYDGHLWAIYPLLGWGIGIVSHALGTFLTHRDPSSREFKRWLERKRDPRADDDRDDDDD